MSVRVCYGDTFRKANNNYKWQGTDGMRTESRVVGYASDDLIEHRILEKGDLLYLVDVYGGMHIVTVTQIWKEARCRVKGTTDRTWDLDPVSRTDKFSEAYDKDSWRCRTEQHVGFLSRNKALALADTRTLENSRYHLSDWIRKSDGATLEQIRQILAIKEDKGGSNDDTDT